METCPAARGSDGPCAAKQGRSITRADMYIGPPTHNIRIRTATVGADPTEINTKGTFIIWRGPGQDLVPPRSKHAQLDDTFVFCTYRHANGHVSATTNSFEAPMHTICLPVASLATTEPAAISNFMGVGGSATRLNPSRS
eukprot:scaffold55515_cov26-Tisochrysis_lutea.AAC.6